MTIAPNLLDQRPVPCLLGGGVIASRQTYSVLRNDQDSSKEREVLYNVSCISEGDVKAVVDASFTAFQSWRTSSVEQRRSIILRAVGLLKDRAGEIADIIVRETVVPKGFARFQVEHGAKSHLEECAASMTEALKTEVISHFPGGQRKYVYRKPFGVVLGIAAWNAPFVLGLRAVIWAIAAGNTAILKSSEHAPLTHLAVAQLLTDSGLPSGVLSVVHVSPKDAPTVTEALIAHHAVRKINFTGSTHVGRIVAITAAKHLKPIILELGGKASVIVLQDADLDLAANNILFGGFLNSNQICMSVNNILVHESVKDTLIAKFNVLFEQHLSTFRAGQDDGHQMRALFTPASAQRLCGLYEDAISKGASVAVGQPNFTGAVVQPVILEDVDSSMRIFAEETFGPVLSAITFKEEAEALHIANQNNAGLAAAVFSRDVERAFSIAQQIEAGQVHVNMHSVHDHGRMPHGGWKESGYGRLGGGVDGIREFTQTQGFTVQTGSIIPLTML